MKGRMISKSIIDNEKLIRCGFFPTMLFQRLIMVADDCGRCLASPEALKTRAFPNDEEFSKEEIERSLSALAREGLILLYEVRGRRYLWLTGWEEHQILRLRYPEYPAPAEGRILKTDEPIYNHIISNSKEEEEEEEEEGEDEGEDEKKDLSLSTTLSRLPSPSPSEAADADTTSGEALGRESIEKTENDRFERFWNAYPRRQKKHEARRVFFALDVDEALLSLMLESIERWRESEQWKLEEGRFIPDAVRWLRGRRWEDEPTDRVQKGSFDTDDFFEAALNKPFQLWRD